ncbi:MAG: hypothetical protein ACREMO_13755 [Gemmatimonadales bacterium]
MSDPPSDQGSGARWLAARTGSAPAPLRERIIDYARAGLDGPDPPGALAEAGLTALRVVTAHRGDRSAALDLLAADALITLALLAQAETAPARLGEFALQRLTTAVNPA